MKEAETKICPTKKERIELIYSTRIYNLLIEIGGIELQIQANQRIQRM